MSSANEGSRSHASQISEMLGTRACASVERLNQHIHAGPGYFAASLGQNAPKFSASEAEKYNTSPRSLFLAPESVG